MSTRAVYEEFLEECTVAVPFATVGTSELYRAWCAWAGRRGYPRISHTRFSMDLATIGQVKRREQARIVWLGRRLKGDGHG